MTVYNNQKILLLDDNRDLLMIVQIILKGQGYETVLATNIEEANQKIRIHRPALILMDVHIADQDGSTYCTQLKTNPDTHEIRVIMMSGDDNVQELTYTGADDFMQKPFDYNDLIGRVQQQVSSSRAWA